MDIEKLIQQKVPVSINHNYHHEELAKLHARGLKSPLSTRDNGGKTRKGGGGGSRGRQGGQNRNPQGKRRSSNPTGENRRRRRRP
jgi:ATP-dependent RNA helicase RhlE